jgi:hypothetical protein
VAFTSELGTRTLVSIVFPMRGKELKGADEAWCGLGEIAGQGVVVSQVKRIKWQR